MLVRNGNRGWFRLLALLLEEINDLFLLGEFLFVLIPLMCLVIMLLSHHREHALEKGGHGGYLVS